MTGPASTPQATTPEPPNEAGGLKTLGIAIAVVAWMAVPVIVLMFTPFAQRAGVAASSMIAGGLATLVGGRRWGALLAVWSVIAIGISPVGLAYPAVGTLFIALPGRSAESSSPQLSRWSLPIRTRSSSVR